MLQPDFEISYIIQEKQSLAQLYVPPHYRFQGRKPAEEILDLESDKTKKTDI
jgi:hypothetical protein